MCYTQRREDAARALDAMDGMILHDFELRIGWGKSMTLPMAPVWPGPNMGVTPGQIPSGAPFAAPGVFVCIAYLSCVRVCVMSACVCLSIAGYKVHVANTHSHKHTHSTGSSRRTCINSTRSSCGSEHDGIHTHSCTHNKLTHNNYKTRKHTHSTGSSSGRRTCISNTRSCWHGGILTHLYTYTLTH